MSVKTVVSGDQLPISQRDSSLGNWHHTMLIICTLGNVATFIST